MDLMEYVKPLLKWWWLILISVIIASSASFIASKTATPLYRTKATLMVGNSIQNPDPSSVEMYTGQQLASTYVQMALREPVLKATVNSLGWDIDWGLLTYKISASVVPQTQLIEIYAVDSDPSNAKALANTVAQQLINLSPSGTSNINQEQFAFIQAQLTDIEGKINSALEDVTQLKVEFDAATSAQQIQDLQNQYYDPRNKDHQLAKHLRRAIKVDRRRRYQRSQYLGRGKRSNETILSQYPHECSPCGGNRTCPGCRWNYCY